MCPEAAQDAWLEGGQTATTSHPHAASGWAGGHYGCEKSSSSIHDQRVEKIV